MPGPASYANTSGSFKLRTWWISEITDNKAVYTGSMVSSFDRPLISIFEFCTATGLFFPHPSQNKIFFIMNCIQYV